MPPAVGFYWTSTGLWIRPKDSREVMTALGAIGTYSAGQQFAWRGMASADYSLTSSLHRRVRGGEAEVRKAEEAMLAEARSWGLGVQPTGYVDDLQLLADLQHYGAPTRLMDFTSNPMTALWFACQSPPQNAPVGKSGLVLALNVTGWPHYPTAGPMRTTWGSLANNVPDHSRRLYDALKTSSPFVVDASTPNDRLRAQEGFFISGVTPTPEVTEPGSSFLVTPFESISLDFKSGNPEKLRQRLLSGRSRGAPVSLPFVALIIDAAIKPKLLRYLESTYNRTARVLFPDYEGFKDYGASSRP